MRYYYLYKGTQKLHLPEQGIMTEPENPKKIYMVDKEIIHPDFEEIKSKNKKNI